MSKVAASFAHVETWVFDLDNTLYQARHRLFDQIDEKMGRFIAERSRSTVSRQSGSRKTISTATARRCAG